MAKQKIIGEIAYKKDPDIQQEVTANDSQNNGVLNKTGEVDFDDLLSSAGEFGLYQLFLFFSTMPFYMYGVFVYYTQLFLTEASPNHWCWIPELENLTAEERRNLAIPQVIEKRYGYSQCESFVANWTEVLTTGLRPNNSWTTTACEHGWEFDKSEIPYPTISSELGWVCEKDSYQATAQAIFFLGSISGGFFIGCIADRFGRLPASVVSNIIGCIGGVATIFASSFTEFAICRFVTGIAYDNCMTMVYLLVLEYVGPRYRTLISNVSFALFYSFFVTALPWLVLLCGHWKLLSLATSLPLAFVVLAPFIMPESPRWLLSKGRVDAAVMKVLAIGRINKKEIPEKLIEQFKSAAMEMKHEEEGSILELLRRPLLRKMFISICLLYASSALVFDGLVRNVGNLNFDLFISFSIVSVTEFPSMVLLAFIMDWIGRKWLVIISTTVCCIISILAAFIGGGLLSVICAVIARFFLNLSYGVVMQWSAELLPTAVRGSGVAVIHICAFVGFILAPYIVYLESYIQWLPMVLIGIIAGSGGLLALMLPETAKKDMPQTFDDAEKLIRNQTLWDIPGLKKKVST